MEQFDPYHRWLGIPPEEQPANHYRLLGLVPYESDPEVIRDAAERQMGHVRRYGLGKHSELSQKVLNVLGGAKACLLNAAQKSEYDARLKAELASRAAAAAPPPVPVQAAAAPPSAPAPLELVTPAAPPVRGSFGKWSIVLAAISGLVLVAIYILLPTPTRPKTDKPVLKLALIDSQALNVGSPLVLRARVNNPEAWAGKVEYRFPEKTPDGAAIDEQSGEIRWTPEIPGVVAMKVLVLSDEGASDEASFTVDVRPEPPKLLPIADRQVDLGGTLQFTAAVANPVRAGEPLVYQLGRDAPRGAMINPQSGAFTWTPGTDPGPGDYQLTVEVLGPAKAADQTLVRVQVRAVNRPPQLQVPETARVVVGSEQRVQFEARDPDQPADRLTFSLIDGPAWASLDAASGQLTCHPTPDVAGRSYTLRVRVSDSASPPLADEKTLTVVVEAAALPGMPAGMASVAPPAPANAASRPPVTASSDRLELAPDKVINLADWDLLPAARIRAEELRLRVLSQTPGSFARFTGGPGSPIVDLCEFSKSIREVYLEGTVISFHDGVSPAEFTGRTETASGSRLSSRPGFPAPLAATERRGVNWDRVRFRSFANADNSRWQGGLATWDSQGQPEYYGQYAKGKRNGFCCVFQAGAPRLLLECAADKPQAVYLLANQRVEKRFADEVSARNDEQAAGLLDQVKRIESDLRKRDTVVEKAIQTELNKVQGQVTARARENMRNRSADREAERQNTMGTIKKITTGTP